MGLQDELALHSPQAAVCGRKAGLADIGKSCEYGVQLGYGKVDRPFSLMSCFHSFTHFAKFTESIVVTV